MLLKSNKLCKLYQKIVSYLHLSFLPRHLKGAVKKKEEEENKKINKCVPTLCTYFIHCKVFFRRWTTLFFNGKNLTLKKVL